jgi:hypothetical protein
MLALEPGHPYLEAQVCLPVPLAAHLWDLQVACQDHLAKKFPEVLVVFGAAAHSQSNPVAVMVRFPMLSAPGPWQRLLLRFLFGL